MKKKKQLISALLIISLTLFSACGTEPSGAKVTEEKTETIDNTIHLNNQATVSSGSGVKIEGNQITITEAGKYEVSGELDNGQLCVDCEGKVTLILKGISITNTDAAAIEITKAKKVTLQLAEGCENVLTSGTNNSEAVTENASGAAIHSKEDLVITGNGALTVCGYLNNGIASTDSLTIKGGSILVSSSNHGLKGKDAVVISGGCVTVSAGSSGIRAGDGDGNGDVEISGGTIRIESGDHGIRAENSVDISGGSIDISSATDGLHSDNLISVSDGSIGLSVQDDGIHADNSLFISGGNVEIAESYEGLEANQITVSGGSISVAATDDGLNACGGARSFGKEDSGKTSEFPVLLVSGGQLYVNAGGDGIDSNGDIQINGGTVIVDGPTNNRNGALDSGTENGGQLLCNGGTVLAIGASGMAECFDQTSTQSFLELTLSDYIIGGATLEISDPDGTILFSHTAAKKFNSVVFSCAGLNTSKTYTVTINGSAHEVVAGVSSGTGSFWGMGGGPRGPGGRP